MYKFYLGIDVSKLKLDCLLLNSENDKRKAKVFENSSKGYTNLLEWLQKQEACIHETHVIIEPTGIYHEAAALALHDAGLGISLVNPARIREYAKGVSVKSKTDAMDSAVLARFGSKEHPTLWQPPTVEVRRLQDLITQRNAIAEDLQRARNREEKTKAPLLHERVKESIGRSIEHFEKELSALQKEIDQHIDNSPDLREKKALLLSIPGVGERVSDEFTALIASRTFDCAEQLANYLGLTPVAHESGTSIRCRPRMSKTGPSHLRKLLYMPAIVAKQCNPHVKALYDRLIGRGKSKMAAIGAAMRKLAHLCFGVIQTRQPYEPNWSGKSA